MLGNGLEGPEGGDGQAYGGGFRRGGRHFRLLFEQRVLVFHMKPSYGFGSFLPGSHQK